MSTRESRLTFCFTSRRPLANEVPGFVVLEDGLGAWPIYKLPLELRRYLRPAGPVVHVVSLRAPLEIVHGIVSRILVFMVDDGEVRRVRDESFCYKAVDQ